ncbi:hypothetical protein CALCODRAFT_496003 [Calocera cornea HHB12733]|uniref:Uncharacterized protein n=1 Tax=Calocera cornea HHB12733 TaxID=1353952 RepID=A0A165G558_9BASI|nr:hypothetical protein CALCODRAFT_496003 [Calocera cornea HHB12733]
MPMDRCAEPEFAGLCAEWQAFRGHHLQAMDGRSLDDPAVAQKAGSKLITTVNINTPAEGAINHRSVDDESFDLDGRSFDDVHMILDGRSFDGEDVDLEGRGLWKNVKAAFKLGRPPSVILDEEVDMDHLYSPTSPSAPKQWHEQYGSHEEPPPKKKTLLQKIFRRPRALDEEAFDLKDRSFDYTDFDLQGRSFDDEDLALDGRSYDDEDVNLEGRNTGLGTRDSWRPMY